MGTFTMVPDTPTSAAVAAAEAGAAFERLRESIGLPAVPARHSASDRVAATAQLADVVSAACRIPAMKRATTLVGAPDSVLCPFAF